RAVANMRDVQRRALLIVPATAVSTVLIAAFFGWAIARRMLELRLEERLNERTRIARELHDTLLQSFQGVLMKFSSVRHLIPERPAEAQKTLDRVVEQARQAINEGRDAVQGLRSTQADSNDLPRAIRSLGEVFAADQGGRTPVEFRVAVEGDPRALAPLVQNDVYRIAGEALRNAFRHSQAGRIEVKIRYEPRQFSLSVRDDGKGIDQKLLDLGGRAGHYGLAGMQERAKLVGAKLRIWSEVDSGTEIELNIPGSAAFAKSSEGR
ncbi:MAG: sensor histidine kinase, partial [Verrucomicrobiota bacterium]